MLLVDANEPQYMLDTLGIVVPCAKEPLNAHGQADYVWDSTAGEEVNVERKTWGELVSDINNVERQLGNYLRRPASHVVLLLEGLAAPSPQGTRAYKLVSRGRKAFAVEQVSRNTPISQYYAWLHSISFYCEIQHSADISGSAYALAAMYKWDQKAPNEHTTFLRYLRKLEWNPNPQVAMLMSLGNNLGIGETRAVALIQAYGTVWNVLSSTPSMLAEIEGVGLKTAEKLLRSIGRTDV